jgi:peptidoglycan/xylan/chitin deacetylase (PgdA/CDA1 family)
LSAAEVGEQLRRTRDALGDAGGPLMRPPYGDETFETNRVARSMGYRVTLWSVNGCDWLDDDAETLAKRILDAAHPGAIVLLHDSLQSWEAEAYRDRTPTFDAVEKVVRALPDWRFVTVSELIALGSPVTRGWVKRTSAADLAALGRADEPPGGLSAA